MRADLDRLIHLLGDYRDIVLLALAILVLVEGAIIILWARRAIQLKRQLAAALDDAERSAAKAAAAVASARDNTGTYRVGDTTRDESTGARILRDGGRPVYSPGRTNGLPTAPAASPARAGASAADADLGSAPAPAPAPAETPVEPPAEYTTPVAQQAAAWVLPEVEASRAPEPTTPAPTTLGWSGTSVPVEPAPDFAVIRDPESLSDVPPARPSPANGNGHGDPAAAVRGAVAWATPVTPAPAADGEPAPTEPVWDLSLLDGNDELGDDELPSSGDILLVEDDATITRLYRVLLESRGYKVRVAADGLEGLDRVNERRPDLVLLDIMMPRMNGIAFLTALRSGSMRDLPVVVLSNFMEKQLVDDALSLGAVEYMVKAQTRPEALMGAVPHWLRGERAFSA